MSHEDTISTEKVAHSPLGASGASRWMNCPGSIQLMKKLKLFHTRSSFAAKEGTAGHEVLARCLEGDMAHEPWEFIGTKVIVEDETFEVDHDMADALNVCYNHVVENIKEATSHGKILKFIEVSMKHSEHDLMFGTTDCAIVAICKDGSVLIWVNDLKYGQGIVVEPTTAQIKYYAVLVADRLLQDKIIKSYKQIKRVTLTIMQPRIPHPDGLIRSKTMTGPALEKWYEEELVPAMEETENPDAILKAGDWCTFCPVKTHCPAIAATIVEFSTMKPPEEMTGEELGKAIEKLEVLISLKNKYEEIAFYRAMKGHKIYGKKLVKKKATRRWRPEIGEFMLVESFGDDAFEKSLKSPHAIEKLPGGKKFVAQYAFQPSNTGLTLAPLSDSRDEVKSMMTRLEELDIDIESL